MAPALPTAAAHPALRTNLLSYPVLDPSGRQLQVGARLQVPAQASAERKVPAVVIVHGSAGVDSRGQMHALDLNRAGIATLEIDMWGARGLAGGSDGRPKTMTETLPDAFGALRVLAADPRIQADRIGLTGFSWGGVVAMLAATKRYAAEYGGSSRFAALAPFYPVCWLYNRVPGYEFAGLTGAPVRIYLGAQDHYDDDAQAGPRLVASLAPQDRALVSVRVFEGAVHGFNMLEAGITQYADPFAHQGKGGLGNMLPHPPSREAARVDLVEFFSAQLMR